MAAIVRHKPTGARFCVLGGSYTKWKSAHGHWFFGDWDPVVDEGAVRLLVVCGADGVIQFAKADEFEVVAIDGKSPQELLGDGGGAPAG